MSALGGVSVDDAGPSVAPDRFHGPGERWSGHWSSLPRPWNRVEHELLSAETSGRIAAAIVALPASQRLVIALRDYIEGWLAEERWVRFEEHIAFARGAPSTLPGWAARSA